MNEIANVQFHFNFIFFIQFQITRNDNGVCGGIEVTTGILKNFQLLKLIGGTHFFLVYYLNCQLIPKQYLSLGVWLHLIIEEGSITEMKN